ncbi:MAG: rRNA maturation RNase YbeY [Bacteriovoracaceae bacterium]
MKRVHQIQARGSSLFFRSTVAQEKLVVRGSKKVSLKTLLELSLKHFSKFLDAESKKSGFGKRDFELSLTLCGAKKIKTLNNDYRGKNYATDVLSFPVHEYPGRVFEYELTQYLNLGDIFICLDVLLKQAKSRQVSQVEEFLDLFCHGFLHVLGYDHERSKTEEDEMFDLQHKLLKKMIKELG